MSKRLVGKKIADRYSLVEKIGEGGMGVVWKAMSFADPSVHYAIKVVQAKAGKNIDQQVIALQKEAATISQLAHPRIVDFIEIGRAPEFLGANSYYIVMELAQGVTLKSILNRDINKDPAFAIQLGMQIADVLDYTHSKGVIHRDIKPQNIMVNRAWKDASGVGFKILDFGISRALETTHFVGGETGPVQDAAGTPLYMAPEQTRLTNYKTDHRSDLYSLGCVLYEVLLGRTPFQAKNRAEIKNMHVHEKVKKLKDIDPSIPNDLSDIICRLLAKNPNERYSSAFSLKSDFIRVLRRHRQGRGDEPFLHGVNDSISANHVALPIIGRDQELAKIEGGFKKVSTTPHGRQIYFLKGETGVGKRKIAYQLRKQFTAKNRPYLTVQFSKYESNLPLHSLCNSLGEFMRGAIRRKVSNVETYAKNLGELAFEDVAPLVSRIPILKSIFNEKFDSGFAEESHTLVEVKEAFLKIFRCVLRTVKVPAIFVHDIQWADSFSLAVLKDLMELGPRTGFFAVFVEQEIYGLHSEPYKEFLKPLERSRQVEFIFLKSLNRASVRALVSTLVSEPIHNLDAVFDNIFERTRGLPLLVVEVIKNYVSSGKLKKVESYWRFDEGAVLSSKLSYESSETAIRSLRTLIPGERNVLDVASILGDVFSFEDLFYDKNLSTKVIAKHLQLLEEKKLIQKMKHRSPSGSNTPVYSFVHKNARRAIYSMISKERRIVLHKFVADLLYSRNKRGIDISAYRIAHHYNLGVGSDTSGSELRQQSRFVKVNLRAAEDAMASSAWQTANHYLLFIIEYHKTWSLPFLSSSEIDGMLESVADIFMFQKKFRQAWSHYDEILRRASTRTTKQRIVSKLMYVNSLMGRSSAAIEVFKRHGYELLDNDAQGFFQTGIRAIKKTIQDRFALDKSFLKKRFKRAKQIRSPREDLLLLHRALGLEFSHGEKKILMDKGGALLRDMSQSQVGFVRFFCRSISIVSNTRNSKSLKHINHPVAAFCSLSVDGPIFGSPEYKKKLSEINSNIDTVWDRDIWLEVQLQIALIAWLDCDAPALRDMYKRLPEIIPTRNEFAPTFVSVFLTTAFARGKKNQLIRQSSLFLKRRQEVGGREEDIGILQIRFLQDLAEGLVSDAIKGFCSICEVALQDRRSHSLPKDSVRGAWNACFLLTGLVFIESELAGEKLDSSVFDLVSKSLAKLLKGLKRTPLGHLAHSIDLIVSQVKDKSRASFSYKTIDLLQSVRLYGNKKVSKDELVQRHKKTDFLHFRSVFNPLLPGFLSETLGSGLHLEEFRKFNRLNLFKSGLPSKNKLGVFADALKEAKFSRKAFLLDTFDGKEKNQVYLVGDGDCTPVDAPEMKDYLLAYEKIKNSFFVPATDQPWISGNEDLAATNFSDSTSGNSTTMLLRNSTQSTKVKISGSPLLQQSAREMNAIIPIRVLDGRSSIMLLQGINLRGDALELREVYEAIGSIVNSLLPENGEHKFVPGSIELEECPWLELWSEGALRKARESTFYLGLNFGSTHYAILYCSIEGEQDMRGFLSYSIWHEMQRLRAKFDESEMNFREITRELDSLFGIMIVPEKLEKFSCVFSVFDRRSSQVYSAQWGNTRPIVVGSKNYIKPGEKGLLETANGKISYFEVNAGLHEGGAYILALQLLDKVPKQVRLSAMSVKHLTGEGSNLNISGLKSAQIVQQFWNASRYRPRYFVVVSRKTSEHHLQNDSNLDRQA